MVTETPPLHPREFVWLGHLDGRAPEPPPDGAAGIRAVIFIRRTGPEDTARTVVVETPSGFEPLGRRIHLHGDLDEGWDWGWRGSAPLETALNVLAAFVHPKAAWRLHWAFCEAVLHGLPVRGGTLDGDDVRGWLRDHAWIGRRTARPAEEGLDESAFPGRARRESETLSPRTRAERVADLVTSTLAPRGDPAQGTRSRGDLDSACRERPIHEAAALLAGSPAEERWATCAILSGRLPAGSRAGEAWRRLAATDDHGLPDSDTLATVAAVWSRMVGKSARERARLVAETIRASAEHGVAWDTVPHLALPLGAGFRTAGGGDPFLAGNPVTAAGTVHQLGKMALGDAALAASATRIGLTDEVLSGLLRSAHRAHLSRLHEERRAVERAAAADAEYVLTAEAARLGRGRSFPPPPTSAPLRRWLLAAPIDVLELLAHTARDPAGRPALAAALRAAGLSFADPAGTIGQAIAWYLEERAPGGLDLPSFLVRHDGLPATPARAAPPPGRR